MMFWLKYYGNNSKWVYSGFPASKARAIHICNSGPWSIPASTAPIIPSPEGIFTLL